MSIGGINSGGNGAIPGHPGLRPVRPDEAKPATVHGHARPAAPATPVVAPEVHGVDDIVPLEAPPGTDPALWSVLTTEERRFFSRIQAVGPLTYGPRSANVPPGLTRGVRIDTVV